jgi:hypothetical protein
MYLNKKVGTGRNPSPRVGSPAGLHIPLDQGTARGRSPSGTPLRVSERKRDELGPVARLHPHQHRVLAGLVQIGQVLADIGRIGDRLPADVEDDVAALHAVIRRRAVGVDRGDRDALVEGADRVGRRKG